MDETQGNSFGRIVSRFASFNELIGGTLIKFIYYAGLVGIGIYTLILVLAAFRIAQYSVDGFVVGLLWAAVSLVVGTVMWRFTCELWILLFKIHERLGDIRDRLPPSP